MNIETPENSQMLAALIQYVPAQKRGLFLDNALRYNTVEEYSLSQNYMSVADYLLSYGSLAEQVIYNALTPIKIAYQKSSPAHQKAFDVRRKSATGYIPPADVRAAAARGLELRREFNRGGTAVGVARARDLSNGKSISAQTIRRMVSYFARHAVDKRPDWSNPSDPTPGYIAWMLWGGDAGKRWANAINTRMKKKPS